MLSAFAAALDATLLASADELAGATELAATELGIDDEAGLLPPPPPPPQAVKLRIMTGRAQVLIKDCIMTGILRCCYRVKIFIVNIGRFREGGLIAPCGTVLLFFMGC